MKSGVVFTKGLSQVLGLSWLYFYTKLKPKTWLRPFVNTVPGVIDCKKLSQSNGRAWVSVRQQKCDKSTSKRPVGGNILIPYFMHDPTRSDLIHSHFEILQPIKTFETSQSGGFPLLLCGYIYVLQSALLWIIILCIY